ncbi:myc proto-oncogene protein-like [Stegodyphus dumicola]|uniref:myc proto-oncogene protein-like n=1 Tax=Stegodyphus dumicola TaxID=202533 RepID=UPI0015AC70C3|nr:myc proto-oncogene protein-like [Stegodyphus dumicola]
MKFVQGLILFLILPVLSVLTLCYVILIRYVLQNVAIVNIIKILAHYNSPEKIVYYPDGESRYIEPCTEVIVTQPYTPASDHCYHQPMPENMSATPVKSPDVLNDNVDSESASESSDDEVDVVTISQPVRMMTFMAPPRRQPERIVQAEKSVRKASLPRRKPATTTVLKQAASALKRTNLRIRKKSKRRTQASSLDSSCYSDSSRCGDSDSEEVDKRVTHNKMERRRREDQKRELQNLRMCIPNLRDNVRASKVNILQEGKHYVEHLEWESSSFEAQLNSLKEKNLKLKKRLNRLRKQCGAAELH